ncbi:MAG: TlpA family protein disulfide reductase, partial [Bacteroidota bacterium]
STATQRPALLDVMSRFANKMRNDDGFRLAEALAKSDEFDGMSSRIGRGVVACPWRYGKVVEIKFKDIEGGEVNLESLKGKVVLLDFWSTTCGPCIATIPKLKRLKEKFGKEFENIGVSLDEDIVSVKRLLREKSIQWPQFFDGNGWHNEIAKKFGVIRLPTVWLIDKRGNLREVDPIEDSLERKIKFLLSD